jgi:hypothetical protein
VQISAISVAILSHSGGVAQRQQRGAGCGGKAIAGESTI